MPKMINTVTRAPKTPRLSFWLAIVLLLKFSHRFREFKKEAIEGPKFVPDVDPVINLSDHVVGVSPSRAAVDEVVQPERGAFDCMLEQFGVNLHVPLPGISK